MTRHNGHAPDVPAGAELRARLARLEKLERMFRMAAPVGVEFVVDTARLAIQDGATGQTTVGRMVELTVCHAAGPVLVYVDPDQADGLAAELVQKAAEARTGILAVSAAPEALKGT